MSEGKNNSREQFVTPDLGFTPKGLYIGGEWLESLRHIQVSLGATIYRLNTTLVFESEI